MLSKGRSLHRLQAAASLAGNSCCAIFRSGRYIAAQASQSHNDRKGAYLYDGQLFPIQERASVELQSKVDYLCKANEELQKKLERLTGLVERQGARNLLQLHDLDPTAEKATKATFRPTLNMVENQTSHACQLDNATLSTRASLGDFFARRERLVREIMQVDRCSWDDAHEKLIEMDIYNEKLYWLYSMPYRIGITLGVIGAVSSCLMVFHGDIALLYARKVVGEDLPEGTLSVQDLSTNQIGTWTWSWMEPMIGVASFVLLCAQFSRSQCIRLNYSPYTERMMGFRASRMETQYLQYDAAMVRSWARHMPSVDWKFMPIHRRVTYTSENRIRNFRGGGG